MISVTGTLTVSPVSRLVIANKASNAKNTATIATPNVRLRHVLDVLSIGCGGSGDGTGIFRQSSNCSIRLSTSTLKYGLVICRGWAFSQMKVLPMRCGKSSTVGNDASSIRIGMTRLRCSSAVSTSILTKSSGWFCRSLSVSAHWLPINTSTTLAEKMPA